jgi:hypothetical protein
MRVLVLALLAALAACGGDHARKPAAAKPKDARCVFKRVWYPPPAPGHKLIELSPQLRARLLKRGHLPDAGTDVVAETKNGNVVAALFRVRRDVDAVKRRLDAVKPPRHAVVTEPLAHFRLIQRGDEALEYGRVGCALFVGAGSWEVVDPALSDIYADNS